MYTENPRHRAKKTGVDREEERAWVGFYRRVRSDPSIAAEVLAQLEADADSKRAHLALFLCCKESLRLAKIRQARNKQFGSFVRWCCRQLFVAPMHRAITAWHAGGELAAACLPDMTDRSTEGQRRRPAGQIKSASALTKFEPSSTDGPVTKPTKSGTDRPSMAA